MEHLYKDLFSGGKGVRQQLVYDISTALNLKPKYKTLLCHSVESIHNSSILHDDVIDSSFFRRNKKSAWVKFSKNKAILAGDYLLAHVSFQICQSGNLDLLKLTSETIKKRVKGEWLQQEVLKKETLKNLDQVHLLKTGSLFEWCLAAPFMCLDKKGPQNILKQVGSDLGRLFQRADDLMDFSFRNKEGKKEFKDLKEGGLNFFGVYLRDKVLIDEKKLRSCRSLKDLKNLVKEEKLYRVVKSFDAMNQKLINKSIKQIESISQFLSKNQREVVNILKNWTQKLYWR